MRSVYNILLLASIFVVTACSYSRHPDSLLHDPEHPGFEYAPAMYHSYPYEPLTQVVDESVMSWKYNSTPYNDYKGKYNSNSLTPVAGTIARGKMDFYFDYEDSDAGRELASAELVNPVVLDDYTLAEGKRLYNLYCDHCHGETGDGNGSIIEAGKLPTMGAYYDKLKDRTAGSIYHTITYGKGIMGAHSSQLSPEQRWLITTWVQILQMSGEAHTASNMADYNALTSAKEAPAETEEAPAEEEAEAETEGASSTEGAAIDEGGETVTTDDTAQH